jgi:methyl-accepting chemotaxis protein
MEATMSTAEETTQSDKHGVSLSGDLVEHVLTHVHKLGASADSMHQHGMVVRGEVEKLMIALQFQDRVSQILCGVSNNGAQRTQTLDNSETDPLPTADDWLQALNQASPMDELIFRPASR